MKKHLLFSSALALACLSSPKANAQNYALSLNGSYVDCGTNALLSPANIKTLECWVKFDNLTANQEILSRSIAGSGIELLVYNGNLAFYCMNAVEHPVSPLYSFVGYPVSNLSVGTWYHIAATWDGTRESMRLYANGISVGGTRTDGGNIDNALPTTLAGSFRIGQWSTLTEDRSLKGTIDEVRVWSTSRTDNQIKGGMYANYSGGAAGLVAYYPFDESTGIIVSNKLSLIGLGNLLTIGAGNYTRPFSPIRFNNHVLNFDGVDDEVRVAGNAKLDLTVGTVECWVRPTAFPIGNNGVPVNIALISNRGGGTTTNTRYSFHMTANTLGLWNGSSYLAATVPAFSLNTWYHLAFVCDGITTQYYINGVLRGSTTNVFNTTVSEQPLVIGLAKFDNINDSREVFKGEMDDIRIWNSVRTAGQIAANYTLPLTGTETNLVANYTFNTGLNAGDNSGLRIALDATPNNLHGTLLNFALTGTASNYLFTTNTDAVILPVQLTQFSAAKAGSASQVSWATAQEQNAKSFVVERSTNGVHFTAIGTVAARNSNTTSQYTFTDEKPLTGTNYYRLQLLDADGKSSFSKIALVKFQETMNITLSPNPASSTLHYSINSLQAVKVSASILSAAGQRVQQFTATLQAGINNLSADISRLPAGNYTLQLLNTPAGMVSSQTFSVVR